MIVQSGEGPSSAYRDLDYAYFKRRIRDRIGIDLESYKPAQMRRRLQSLMQRANAASFTEYFRVLDKDPVKLQEFEDKLTINFSEFFRNPERIDDLRTTVLPRLLGERPRLRVWSAGCSYGGEPYTLALLLSELAPGPRPYILATDVDERTLARAAAGDSYSEQDVRFVPPATLQTHFHPAADGRWAINPNIKSMVTFRGHDLLRDPFESDFDLVVCRNVAIYFTDEAKQKLYRRFFEALRVGGFLFVGGTELLANPDNMGFSTALLNFYQKSFPK